MKEDTRKRPKFVFFENWEKCGNRKQNGTGSRTNRVKTKKLETKWIFYVPIHFLVFRAHSWQFWRSLSNELSECVWLTSQSIIHSYRILSFPTWPTKCQNCRFVLWQEIFSTKTGHRFSSFQFIYLRELDLEKINRGTVVELANHPNLKKVNSVLYAWQVMSFLIPGDRSPLSQLRSTWRLPKPPSAFGCERRNHGTQSELESFTRFT